MAWEWSHTPEDCSHVRENISGKSREWLEIVYAEWRVKDQEEQTGESDFDIEVYESALVQARRLRTDVLADYVSSRAEEFRTCENGGGQAWACPYGCGCHMVSFDREVQ